MMAAAVQSFMAPDVLATPGFFTAAINAADEGVNPFETSFKAGTATIERGNDHGLASDDHHHVQHNHQATDLSILHNNKADAFSPLFGFSPRASPAPFEDGHLTTSNPATLPGIWGPSKPENRPPLGLQTSVHVQAPSPPNSAKHSPAQWQFGDVPPPMFSPLHQILAHNQQGHRTRTEYGQVTPPNDRSPDDCEPSCEEREQQLTEQTRTTKRKRGAPTSQSTQASEPADKSPAKRQRKSAAHSKTQSAEANEPSAQTIEDAKRSKFLERNRVAASKCRQKKKEWTSNLETRARELQNSKTQLTMIVASLKEEILFLKGELLKHSTCGCTRIREYLNREVATMSQPVYTRSRIGSKTNVAENDVGSRHASVSDEVPSQDGTDVNANDGPAKSPAASQADAKRGHSAKDSPRPDGADGDGLGDILAAELY